MRGTAAARSLYELLLDLKILADDKTTISAERFHAFPDVEKYRVAKNLVNFADAHPTLKMDVSHQRRFLTVPGLKARIDSIITGLWGLTKKGKPKRPDHWTAKNIKERAQSLGLRYEQLYYEAYPLTSWYIHSGSTGYAGLNEGALEAVFGQAHILAQKVFLEATLICADEIKLSQGIQGLRGILENLRLTPGKVVVDEQIKALEEARKQ